jgi:hypothetical protein
VNEQARKDIDKAVARGVKLLDKKKPTWFKRIKLDRLDMPDAHACILGQVYAPAESSDPFSRGPAGFFIALERLGFYKDADVDETMAVREAQKYGFALEDMRPEACSYLTEKWVRIIKRRLKAA